MEVEEPNSNIIIIDSYINFSFQGETDEEAELQFENFVVSSDEDNESDEIECLQSKKSSVLGNAVVRLIIMFVMTWKIMHNLSDAAVSVLFCFLKQLLELLTGIVQCKALKRIAELLPRSLYMIRKYLGVNRDD